MRNAREVIAGYDVKPNSSDSVRSDRPIIVPDGPNPGTWLEPHGGIEFAPAFSSDAARTTLRV